LVSSNGSYKNIYLGETRMEIVPPDMFSHIISGLKEGHSYAIQVGTKLKHGKYRGHWSAKIYLHIPPLNLSCKCSFIRNYINCNNIYSKFAKFKFVSSGKKIKITEYSLFYKQLPVYCHNRRNCY
jgi:hypothetical protein